MSSRAEFEFLVHFIHRISFFKYLLAEIDNSDENEIFRKKQILDQIIAFSTVMI